MAQRGRPKGIPKTGGRKVGSTNKRNDEVRQILEEKGFNVIEKLIELYERTCLEEYTGGVAAKCLSELASYCYPKLKQVDHSGEIANPFMDKTLEELKALVKEKLK